MDRVYRPVRRECRRIRHSRGRGRAEAAYLAPGGGRCCGMDSGREASAFLFRARGLCGLRPPLHRSCRWRPGRYSAYVPNLLWQTSWKRYRGGQTTPIYIVRLSDLALEKVPRENSNDSHPIWFNDTVYFLSDRNGAVTLFAYDTKAKTVKQVVENKGLDFKSLSAGPDALVYEQFGGIYLFDPASGKSKKVSIRIAGDLPATRPHFEMVSDKIQAAAISPAGARAVFEARGEILTVPEER